MAFRRRRKPKVLWLPIHGRDFSNVPETDFLGNGIGGANTVYGTGAFTTDIQPVTFDYSDSASQEEGTDFRSLHELTSGNSWRLRRIVGKFHAAAVMENNSEVEIPLVQVAAAFIVNRTDPDGNSFYNFSNDINAGPLAQDGAEDPWIWRRSWMLSPVPRIISTTGGTGLMADINSINGSLGFQGCFPQTTADYGSVQDGPHIDQKTARVIGPQERLFFWMQARIINVSANVNNANVVWNLDYRLLGSLRLNSGNRRNASR